MASSELLILASDNVIELCELKDTTTGALVTGATVTARVLDTAGSPVSGVPDPITFTEVAGRSGLYRGTIPEGAGYANGDDVTVKVTAVDGSNTRVFTEIAAVVEVE